MFQKLLAQCLAQTNGEQMLIVNIAQGHHPKNSAGAKIRAPCSSGPKAQLWRCRGQPAFPTRCAHTPPSARSCPPPIRLARSALPASADSVPGPGLAPPPAAVRRWGLPRSARPAVVLPVAAAQPTQLPRISVLRPGSPRAAGHVKHPLAAVLV